MLIQMSSKIYIGGYRDISLVDVYRSVTYTLWLCKCNYNCPFCHNWHLAIGDPASCKWIDIEEIINKLREVSKLIDYIHVTGGEPLLQINSLRELYMRSRETGLKNSLDSNLSIPNNLSKLLDEKLLDHVASDLKIPFDELTGLGDKSLVYWRLFIESIEILSNYNVLFELRIPVARGLTIKYISNALIELKNLLDKMSNYYVLVFPLTAKQVVSVRNKNWCREYCDPDYNELVKVSNIAREILDTNVIVKYWWNIG